MYQTRVFTLDEVTEKFFDKSRVIFIPRESSLHLGDGLEGFFTEKRIKTPLGSIEVEFDRGYNEHTGGTAFTLHFLTQRKKELRKYMRCSFILRFFGEHPKLEYHPNLIFSKDYFYHDREVPKSVIDITIEGIRLSELRDHSDYVAERKVAFPFYHFVGRMIPRMELIHPYTLFDFYGEGKDLDKNKRKRLMEKYKEWKKIWTEATLNLAKAYSGYITKHSIGVL